MHLEQVTMFGVRGERFRIKKSSPIARAEKTLSVRAEKAETMTWKCLACGHRWRDLRECKGVCRAGCPACGSRNILDCNVGDADTEARERTPRGCVPTKSNACDGCMRVGVTNCLACIGAGKEGV